jgi:hypothetical protein
MKIINYSARRGGGSAVIYSGRGLNLDAELSHMQKFVAQTTSKLVQRPWSKLEVIYKKRKLVDCVESAEFRRIRDDLFSNTGIMETDISKMINELRGLIEKTISLTDFLNNPAAVTIDELGNVINIPAIQMKTVEFREKYPDECYTSEYITSRNYILRKINDVVIKKNVTNRRTTGSSSPKPPSKRILTPKSDISATSDNSTVTVTSVTEVVKTIPKRSNRGRR